MSLTDSRALPPDQQTIFKSKRDMKYLQVEASIINNSKLILTICSDITRVKEMEKQGKRIRSQFFSSVAHELRTPLNSIIPILKLVLALMEADPNSSEQKLQYIRISLNSAIHL